jgi:hypothetical protein
MRPSTKALSSQAHATSRRTGPKDCVYGGDEKLVRLRTAAEARRWLERITE